MCRGYFFAGALVNRLFRVVLTTKSKPEDYVTVSFTDEELPTVVQDPAGHVYVIDPSYNPLALIDAAHPENRLLADARYFRATVAVFGRPSSSLASS